MKKIIFLSFAFMLLSTSACDAGWFSKEKEIKDEYLEKLFTPNIPFESLRVIEDAGGRRFIVVKTKEKINEKLLNEYDDLLLSRGVNIYGTFYYGVFSWQKTVTDFAITITRKVEGEPDAIEISESVVKDPIKKEPIVAASAKGKEIKIAIEKDFGKKWKKIKMIPDKEPKAPEPRIGKYPGAKLIEVSSYGKGHTLIYVSKDLLKNITNYYEKKLREIYKEVSVPLKKEQLLEIYKEYEKLKKPYKHAYSFEEQLENPKIYAHPLKIFEIRTICQRLDLRGSKQTTTESNMTWVTLKRSIDPNLINYIEIEIKED